MRAWEDSAGPTHAWCLEATGQGSLHRGSVSITTTDFLVFVVVSFPRINPWSENEIVLDSSGAHPGTMVGAKVNPKCCPLF